jgi:hypothetical protein
MSNSVSAYIERDKKFFRKIENSQKLPSFFAEKTATESTEYTEFYVKLTKYNPKVGTITFGTG